MKDTYKEAFISFIIESIEEEHKHFKNTMLEAPPEFIYNNYDKISLYEKCYNYLINRTFWSDRMLSLIQLHFFSDVEDMNEINFPAESYINIIYKITEMVEKTNYNDVLEVNTLFVKTFITEEMENFDFY